MCLLSIKTAIIRKMDNLSESEMLSRENNSSKKVYVGSSMKRTCAKYRMDWGLVYGVNGRLKFAIFSGCGFGSFNLA